MNKEKQESEKEFRNINNTKAFHPCTSCQICSAVCPKDAITIELDKEGFYRPIVNEELCIGCGICVKTCYKFDDHVKKSTTQSLNDKPLYAAWVKDEHLLRQTTSGGIGDLLARQLIDDGYKVVGVIYDKEKIRAEHHIALNKEETIPFRGSKYIQSYTEEALKKVISYSKNEKFAVFGTPCQIYALYQYAALHKIKDNFVLIDLFCHGCPPLTAWKKYQNKIKHQNKVERFDHVAFRSKVRGWGTFNVVFEREGNIYFTNKSSDDEFYELFFCDQILNTGCNTCLLRGTLEYTDIRLGDFWGKKFLWNRKGVSAVSLATAKGEFFFFLIEKEIECEKCGYEDCLPYQSWDLVYEPKAELREKLLSCLSDEKKDIKDAVKILHIHQSKKSKLKRYVKSVLRHLPFGVTATIKRII